MEESGPILPLNMIVLFPSAKVTMSFWRIGKWQIQPMRFIKLLMQILMVNLLNQVTPRNQKTRKNQEMAHQIGRPIKRISAVMKSHLKVIHIVRYGEPKVIRHENRAFRFTSMIEKIRTDRHVIRLLIL